MSRPDEMFKIVVQPIAFKEEHLPAVSFLLIPSLFSLLASIGMSRDITGLASNGKNRWTDRQIANQGQTNPLPFSFFFLFSRATKTFPSGKFSLRRER